MFFFIAGNIVFKTYEYIVIYFATLLNTFQAWIYHCHFHPLLPANCCRSYRLVVDEDDLEWVENLRKLPHVLVIPFHVNFHSKTHSRMKIKSVFRAVKGMPRASCRASWEKHSTINPPWFDPHTCYHLCIKRPLVPESEVRYYFTISIYLKIVEKWN